MTDSSLASLVILHRLLPEQLAYKIYRVGALSRSKYDSLVEAYKQGNSLNKADTFQFKELRSLENDNGTTQLFGWKSGKHDGRLMRELNVYAKYVGTSPAV
jgi:hypothetical protein